MCSTGDASRRDGAAPPTSLSRRRPTRASRRSPTSSTSSTRSTRPPRHHCARAHRRHRRGPLVPEPCRDPTNLNLHHQVLDRLSRPMRTRLRYRRLLGLDSAQVARCPSGSELPPTVPLTGRTYSSSKGGRTTSPSQTTVPCNPIRNGPTPGPIGRGQSV
jgi:hypothetical protein